MAPPKRTLAKLTKSPTLKRSIPSPTRRATEIHNEAQRVQAQRYIFDAAKAADVSSFDIDADTLPAILETAARTARNLDPLAQQRARLLDVLGQRGEIISEWVHSLAPFGALRKRLEIESARLALPYAFSEVANSLVLAAEAAVYDAGYYGGDTEDFRRAKRAINVLRGGHPDSSAGVDYRNVLTAVDSAVYEGKKAEHYQGSDRRVRRRPEKDFDRLSDVLDGVMIEMKALAHNDSEERARARAIWETWPLVWWHPYRESAKRLRRTLSLSYGKAFGGEKLAEIEKLLRAFNGPGRNSIAGIATELVWRALKRTIAAGEDDSRAFRFPLAPEGRKKRDRLLQLFQKQAPAGYMSNSAPQLVGRAIDGENEDT